MTEETKRFDQFIKDAQRILITAHISPDPDALSSLLLMGTTLQENFGDKNIYMVLEEEPVGLDFLRGYSLVEFKPLLKAIEDTNPQLIVLLDGNNYDRFSRADGGKIRQLVKKEGIK